MLFMHPTLQAAEGAPHAWPVGSDAHPWPASKRFPPPHPQATESAQQWDEDMPFLMDAEREASQAMQGGQGEAPQGEGEQWLSWLTAQGEVHLLGFYLCLISSSAFFQHSLHQFTQHTSHQGSLPGTQQAYPVHIAYISTQFSPYSWCAFVCSPHALEILSACLVVQILQGCFC